MTDNNIGQIEWRDLTVDNAEDIRDFYQNVVGWETQAVSMGEYDDFNMNLPESGETIAGVCHARGSNADFPAQWLMYVRVANVHDSASAAVDSGGSIIRPVSKMGNDEFCVIQDPAGAVLGLISRYKGSE